MSRFSLLKGLFCVAVATSTVTSTPHVANAASCSAVDASEVVRLRSELTKLVQKNQHDGVISTFRKMLELAKKKCELQPDDYKTAAYSARNVGDIAQAIAWFEAGGDAADATELKTRFGQVSIKEKAGDLVKDGGMPFAPDERAAVEVGTKELKSSGKFTGYLPIGTYKFGTKSFEVKTTGIAKL